jgi:hypothetical protein
MKPLKVGKPLFCHSGLDPESSYFNMFWIYPEGHKPAFAGMTIIGLLTRSSSVT